MKTVSVMAFDYLELTQEAKSNVVNWLDEWPLEYDNGDGTVSYQYFYELDDSDIDEHCQLNEYLFDKNGRPIHNLVEA
jgi:hypothetical protein